VRPEVTFKSPGNSTLLGNEIVGVVDSPEVTSTDT
jgi:hypothetical protein